MDRYLDGRMRSGWGAQTCYEWKVEIWKNPEDFCKQASCSMNYSYLFFIVSGHIAQTMTLPLFFKAPLEIHYLDTLKRPTRLRLLRLWAKIFTIIIFFQQKYAKILHRLNLKGNLLIFALKLKGNPQIFALISFFQDWEAGIYERLRMPSSRPSDSFIICTACRLSIHIACLHLTLRHTCLNRIWT